jgi:pSer/pThr/pTyr-binding forkhead associated (FHA) protein
MIGSACHGGWGTGSVTKFCEAWNSRRETTTASGVPPMGKMTGEVVSDNDNGFEAPVETTSVFREEIIKELDASGASSSEPADLGVERLAPGTALLVVKRGPNAGSRFLLDQATTSAGRHPDSDIFLDDVTVSRRHAEFRLGEGDFQVVDVGSLNGTYVNREPVDMATLSNGDEVQIGKFRLVFLSGPRDGSAAS